jgi:hypothetical protein
VPELRQRIYTVRVAQLQITELDVSWDIVKSKKKDEHNSCSLNIYGLSADSRAQIEALSLKPKKDGLQSGNIRVEIEAGYETTGTSLIFRGDLRTAVSSRQGSEIVTTIEGEDGGRSVLRARIAKSFGAGTDYAAAVKACASAMGVGLGNLADVTATIRHVYKSGLVLSGNASDSLRKVLRPLGLTYSIQNGVLQLQRAGAPLNTQAVLLSQDTGLVGSPERDANGIVTATSLLIPELIVGGVVVFNTKDLKGAYQIQRANLTGEKSGRDWYVKIEAKPQ